MFLKEPRTELSTFLPKLNVTPAGIGAAAELFSRVESSVVFLVKENKAAGVEVAELLLEEDGGGRTAAVAGSVPPCFFFSSETPSADPPPYWRSMLARWRS